MVLSDWWYRFLGRVVIFSALVLMVMINALYYLNYCPCHSENEEDYSETDGWYCLFLGNPEAIIGALVLLCNAILFYYISKQIRQTNTSIQLSTEANLAANRSAQAAEKSNKQTTRTIDMMVNGARGKLEFHSGWMPPNKIEAHYCFKNVGDTPLTIRQFNVQFTLLENTENYPEPFVDPDKLGVINYNVGSGAYYSTWEHDGIPRSNIYNFHTGIPDPTKSHSIGNTHYLFAQFLIRYATVFGIEYIFRVAVVYHGDSIQQSGNWHFEEDRPHMFMGTFPSEVLKL